MPLLKPNTEDTRKLHNEVLQLLNQRFLLCTAAITIFGIGLGWLVPKQTPQVGETLGGAFVLVPIILSIVLLMLSVLHHFLKEMIRVITTYMDITGASNWEKDWVEYRDKERCYIGYSKPQTMVLLVLNGVTVLFPFLIAVVYSQRIEFAFGVFSLVVVGLISEVIIYGLGFRKWGDRELHARDKWTRLSKGD